MGARGSAGYSGTPLSRKLGIVRADQRVALLGAPDSVRARVAQESGARLGSRLRADLDVIVLFARDRVTLERRLPALRRSLAPDGGLWLAWPKRSSGYETGLTENVLRELVLPTGLVDNKVCAVDELWSALRFVIRRADRSG